MLLKPAQTIDKYEKKLTGTPSPPPAPQLSRLRATVNL
jgi:hypothetical protein